MRRIGEIAARLVANPVELVAAANQKRSTEFEGGAAMPGGATATPPVTLYGRGGPERDVNESCGNTDPAVVVGKSEPSRATNPPILSVVWSNRCMDRAFPTRSPRAARSIHLVLVDSHSTFSGLGEIT